MHACLRLLQPCDWQIASAPLAQGVAGACMESEFTFAKMGQLIEEPVVGML